MARIRIILATTAALVGLATASKADLDELFSRYVRVIQPHGSFARTLTNVNPAPAEWQEVSDSRAPLTLRTPPRFQVDPAPNGTRVLLVTWQGEAQPRPALRIDRFEPKPDEPTDVDAEYVEQYAEEYPAQAFGGKFTVSDRGLVLLGKKTRLAMVGGRYVRGAQEMVRLQWAYLSKEEQLFLTFDCAASDWELCAEPLARMLLSVNLKSLKR